MQSNKLVLIIDDEPAIAGLLGSAFRVRGHDVVTATNGPDGIARARERRPDAVVVDLVMPDMDGFRVLEALRSDATTADVPVLVMSAGFDPTVGPRAHREGVPFLAKPFDWTRLVHTVEELLTGERPASA